jgi:FRG domain-containing protein
VDSEWEWLSIAQHHGLPTRLLDWTYSPHVALHFATNELDKMDRDGIVWMVDFVEIREWLPPPLRQVLDEHNAYSFSASMLDEKFKKITSVEQLSGRLPEFVIFFEPPSLDPRIVNQFGLFSFMNRPTARLDDWLAQDVAQMPLLAKKIVIPAELKWEVRDKLDNMNITERVIMPGLDGLCTWLKRWYYHKPKTGAVKAAAGNTSR